MQEKGAGWRGKWGIELWTQSLGALVVGHPSRDGHRATELEDPWSTGKRNKLKM